MYIIRVETAIISSIMRIHGRRGNPDRREVVMEVNSSIRQTAGGQMGRMVALVVDDEALIRDMVAKILSRHGFAVAAASGAQQAAAACYRPEKAISLAIVDIHLPESGGQRSAGEIRRRFPEAVIILTGIDVHVDIEALLAETEVDGFVAKPYGVSQLMTAVREAFDRKGVLAPGRED